MTHPQSARDAEPLAVERLVGGRYLVQEELAAGGMGVVWRALDRSTGAELALKRLSTAGAHAGTALVAFQREYQVLKGISHPRIIRVFDYGVDEVGPYYTMELLGGRDLRVAAPVDWPTACTYLRDVATSLSLLHARKFVHRDISPANVRVTLDGHCKLLDFGALTPFGPSRMIMGTAPMVPPEALSGEPLDQRSDLYALGALAYWTITGRHAYPAKNLNELSRRWQNVPPALISLRPDVPADLDQLVMSLLSADPRARPSSAAEVISRLTSIASLTPEKSEDESSRLASFLTNPRFAGRREELMRIDSAIGVLSSQGTGTALRFEAMPGMGRSRLLDEAGLRAQLAGAIAVRVDASAYGRGSALENLALRLLEAAPLIARQVAGPSYLALRALGAEVAEQLARVGASSTEELSLGANTASVEDWVVAVSRRVPLVLLIDNLERADAPSLALFAALARRAPSLPLALLFAERSSNEAASFGLTTLRAKCESLRMDGLSASETLELARSLFGDEAANVERFAGWLHAQTVGTPLYFLELVRQLVARDLIRLVGGLWVLPQQRPDAALPERLEIALAERVQRLSLDARALCGRLALHRLELSYALCKQLLPERDDAQLEAVLDELGRADVLTRRGEHYAFANAALRDAVAQSMLEYERLDNHRQLGAALSKLHAPGADARMRMEAGWHLIQGGSDTEGADLIMHVTCDSVAARHLIADLYHVGQTVAAALEVYTRQRRSAYERMPLLGTLAYAGFYENPVWGDRYGDQALDVLQDISGLATARRLRRFCGGFFSLMFGLWSAYVRFLLTPKRERPYSFREVIIQLLGTATTVTAVAASSLDAERAQRVAQVIEPFSVLPDRLSPVGIYQFCVGLQQIARERQAEATKTFELLLTRFRNPRYYPTLPPDARLLYTSGLLFAIGAFTIFRANSQAALRIADQLDASGMKMYAMVASQLRYLFHANRGEIEQARKHREQVELHAVQVGSAAQVERWESPALLPLGIYTGDVMGATRAMHRLQMDTSAVYLRPYRRLAEATSLLLSGATNVEHVLQFLQREVMMREPRGFIGWATTNAGIVRGFLQRGQAERAESFCLEALKHVTDVDREYAVLFMDLDLQLCVAQAALGKTEVALTRLDGLLERHASSNHPLVLGLLHETRARIAHAAGRRDAYDFSTRQAERWLRPTNMPQLIAKCERLWELSRMSTGFSMRPDPLDPASAELTSAAGIRTETSFATLNEPNSQISDDPPTSI